MIWYLPLEYLDARYTILMDRQLKDSFKKYNVSFTEISGIDIVAGQISTGAFLDSDGTNYFKFSQLQKICCLFKNGEVQNGDVFFVSDLWFPGLECIKYMAMFHKIEVKICGIFHAGSWTTTDYVALLKEWAHDIEVGWFKMIDKIFVGSKFHKQEILNNKICFDKDKILVTGLPFSVNDIRTSSRDKICKNKKDIVIFSGRLDLEKHPEFFDEMKCRVQRTVYANEHTVEFIKTMPLKLNKEDYFDLLARSKVIFSAAEQENFGYGILEAVALSVVPVVPDTLSYIEMYPKVFRYSDLDEACRLIINYLNNPPETAFIANYYSDSADRIVSEIIKLQ
jgi:glycosyltransferase involved in cell wall biosynthesis